MNMTDEMAEETIDVINAAIENLWADLDAGDDGALEIVRAFTGKTDLSREGAGNLIETVNARFTEFAKDVLG